MDESESGLKDFLEHWFAGFGRGMEALDEAGRAQIFSACGQACAQSYTVPIFRQAWQDRPDLDGFVQALSQRIPGGRYVRSGPDTITATYSHCGCDLVRLGLVRSPALCACSAANLGENLEQALGVPVTVEVQASILRGGAECVLVARLSPAGAAAFVTWCLCG